MFDVHVSFRYAFFFYFRATSLCTVRYFHFAYCLYFFHCPLELGFAREMSGWPIPQPLSTTPLTRHPLDLAW